MGAYEFQWAGSPSIFFQPLSQTRYAGSDVTFSVGAAGSLPLSWQWNFNKTAILDATNSSLGLSGVATNQAGDYYVVVTNSMGSITSQVAVLTVVDTAPSITLQPLDQTVYAGTNVVFTAGAEGSLPLSWRWRFNGNAIPDATNASLALEAVTTNQTGGYSVVVTNYLSSITSQVAVLTVLPVSITLQPLSQAVAVGSNVTFTAAAAGTFPLFWHWNFDGKAIEDATNSSLTLTAVTTNAAGVYSVTVSNAFGSALSTDATLTVLVPSISYVWQDSPNPTPPYDNWATAAHTIQDAVDVAVPGGEIVVTNVLYATGGRPAAGMIGVMSNRVAVDIPLKVRSVNGPAVTIIQGYQVPQTTNDFDAVRCVHLAEGAVLSGFTCTGGATRRYQMYAQWGDMFGGGVYCVSTNAIVTNCILSGNSAFLAGGGAYSGTLNNCALTGNTAFSSGGGAASVNMDRSLLNNCVLTGNWAYSGGGVSGGTLYNCTVTGNSAPSQGGGAAFNSTLYNSIVVSNSAPTGTNYDNTCTLNYSCTMPMPPSGAGNIALDPLFVDYAGGNLRLQSNSPCINAGNNAYVYGIIDLDGNPRIIGGTVDIGAYEFQSLIVIPPVTHYVWQDSLAPTPPYTDWTTAAHVLQDAVDAARPGDEVIVTNGIYAIGGRTLGNSLLTNRVAVDKPLTIRSVNGADVTVIQGYQVPGVTNGDAAIRCVYLRSNAVLSGFTLTNGATRQTPQGGDSEAIGGGAYCDSWGSCLITHCKLIGNAAADSGGGAFSCGFDNCLLTGNSAANTGGGACFCALTNCTITGNSATYGGGAAAGVLLNCIVYYNSDVNWVATIGSTMSFSCTTPLPGPVEWQNITNPPLFVDQANRDFHLQVNSHCINAGNNAFVSVTTDLDGNPRIDAGVVDLGAYEFQGASSMISYAWLQQYGLPTDGSADFVDTDGDGMNNWQEWVCGTCPTNALSVLRMLSAATVGSNVSVTWQSVAGVNYVLERSSDLRLPLTIEPTNIVVSGTNTLVIPTNIVIVATNVVGQACTTSYADTNATGAGPFFYRVSVKAP